jgi:DNA-binding NtrC family response regulator
MPMASREKSADCVAEVDPPTARQRHTADSFKRVGLVSVSPAPEDHESLQRCLPDPWILHRACDLRVATELLRARHGIPVVVCERDLQPTTWKQLLVEFAAVANPPLLIVTSRCPDERLWAEALNLGAHDVLAKPVDSWELTRTLHSAWNQWTNRGKHLKPAGAPSRRNHRTGSAA